MYTCYTKYFIFREKKTFKCMYCIQYVLLDSYLVVDWIGLDYVGGEGMGGGCDNSDGNQNVASTAEVRVVC